MAPNKNKISHFFPSDNLCTFVDHRMSKSNKGWIHGHLMQLCSIMDMDKGLGALGIVPPKESVFF